MSSDGGAVAIGATGNDENGDRSGNVRVYSLKVSRNGTTSQIILMKGNEMYL